MLQDVEELEAVNVEELLENLQYTDHGDIADDGDLDLNEDGDASPQTTDSLTSTVDIDLQEVREESDASLQTTEERKSSVEIDLQEARVEASSKKEDKGLVVPRDKAIMVKAKLRGTKKELPAVIDSGAGTYCISRKLVELLRLEHEVVNAKVPITVNTASVKTKGLETDSAISLPLDIKLGEIKISITVKAYVIDGIRDRLYLGMPFIRKYASHIPWNQTQLEEMTFEEATQMIRLEEMFVNSNDFLRKWKPDEEVALGMVHVRSTEDPGGTDGTKHQDMVNQVLDKFKDVVTEEEPTALPPERKISHRITLIEGSQPTSRPQYRLSAEEKIELQKQVEELLNKGFIKESASPYNAPILFVKKKGGELRMCVDYRLLNLHTVKDRFPLPLIEDILNELGQSKCFSKLDLRNGYHQLRIHPEDTEKTAFSTEKNHYEWLVMPFGLTNAPSTFQRTMNGVLNEYLGKFVQVYLDDIIIYSKDAEEHMRHVSMVLDTLRRENLICKKQKCEFFKDELKFLGFVVGKEGIKPDPDKLEAVREWKLPQNAKEAQRFLGLTNFYRRFVEDYAKIAHPLLDLAADKVTSGKEQAESFEVLKEKLCTAPLMMNPVFQEGYQFAVTTDACDTALGFTLEQLDPMGNRLGVIAYGSKKLQENELRYPVREKEFMAIIWALKTWRHLLLHRKFVIKTDYQSLQFIRHQNQLVSGRLARWIDFLCQFDFDIKYIKGSTNGAADALSRRDSLEELSVMLEEQQITEIVPAEDLKKRILDGYERDPDLKPIYVSLRDGIAPPKKIAHYAKHFKLDNGYMLYTAVLDNEDGYRICIPQFDQLRSELISNVHDNPSGAHFGTLRCTEVLQRQFYWPKMMKQVHKFVATCHACQKSKPVTTLTQGLLKPLDVPGERFSEITMDFLTGIPETEQGYNMVFVIVDRLSKRARFIPCSKHLTGEDAAKLFLQHYFVNFGLPKKIYSDKDVRFMGSFWKTIWHILGTSLLFTTTSHPQTDGQSERMMRVINQMLRSVCQRDITTWDKFLPAVEFAYNSTLQTSTNQVPFEIDYGMKLNSPIFHSSWSLDNANPSAENFATRMKAILLQTQDNLIDAQKAQEEQHNKTHRAHEYKVGDWVLLDKLVWGGVRRSTVNSSLIMLAPTN